MHHETILYLLPAVFSTPHDNVSIDPSNVVCVYPLSGQYGLLQRLNFYCLLTFAALAHRNAWLVGGAFAALMTYSGVTAIHAILLAVISGTHHVVFDLDVVGCWSILSAAAIILGPMMEWSITLRSSSARPIIRSWGVLVSVGTLCAFVALNRRYPGETPCSSAITENILLESFPSVKGTFDCTYSCFSTHQPLRRSADITIALQTRIFGTVFGILVPGMGAAVLVMTFFSLIACLKWAEQGGSVDRSLDGIPVAEYGLIKQSGNRGFLRSGSVGRREHIHVLFLRVLTAFGSPPFLVASIVVNEVYILGNQGIPSEEAAGAVGQWSTWVATGLVVVAALINYGNEQQESRVQGDHRRLSS